MVEPTTFSSRKKMRVSSACVGRSPLVAPEMTRVPPGRSDFTEWDQVAAPTVSMTASTRCGSRAPGSYASNAPSSTARSRLALSRLVAKTRSPAAFPSTIAAVATRRRRPDEHGVPGRTPALVNSIRYAVSQAVGRQAASAKLSPAGLGRMFQVGTVTCSAKVPW